jgi:hypothetical protein
VSRVLLVDEVSLRVQLKKTFLPPSFGVIILMAEIHHVPEDSQEFLARLCHQRKVGCCFSEIICNYSIDIGAIDHGLSVVPTKEWQDNLSRRLAGSSRSSLSPAPSFGSFRASTSSSTPATQRRRLNDSIEPAYSPDWDGMYTFNQEGKTI